MTVNNPGPATAIVGVEGDVARNIELHTHVSGDGGMMQMRRLDRIELPTGAPVALAPGGLHVMLIGLTRDLLPGQSVTLQLRLADGRRHEVVAPVEPLPGASTGSPAPGAADGADPGAADGR
jgi:copper(I)-binding protein